MAHAREHLHSLTRSLEFMLGDRRDEMVVKRHVRCHGTLVHSADATCLAQAPIMYIM
jgi:hypothetical protein